MDIECHNKKCRDDIDTKTAKRCFDCGFYFCDACLHNLSRPGFETSDLACSACLPTAIRDLDYQILVQSIRDELAANYMDEPNLKRAITQTIERCQRAEVEARKPAANPPAKDAGKEFADHIFKIGCDLTRIAARAHRSPLHRFEQPVADDDARLDVALDRAMGDAAKGVV